MLVDHPVFPILLATDLDASRTFYRDALGLELIREDAGDRLVFRCGSGTQRSSPRTWCNSASSSRGSISSP